MKAIDIVAQYYQAFNDKNWSKMIALADENIQHDSNEGATTLGIEAFKKFVDKMEVAYDEKLIDIVLLSEPTNARVAAEFIVNGTYLHTEEGLPIAKGQKYVLPAGAFLEVKNDKITRVTTYYNLEHWIQLVNQ
ncbi:MAG TPA: ketosteroid isomerase-related protein [Chitinophagales bacterium]|nr:ketosteroid isomerase-related protein [Chitinophagales bacterium]